MREEKLHSQYTNKKYNIVTYGAFCFRARCGIKLLDLGTRYEVAHPESDERALCGLHVVSISKCGGMSHTSRSGTSLVDEPVQLLVILCGGCLDPLA